MFDCEGLPLYMYNTALFELTIMLLTILYLEYWFNNFTIGDWSSY